MHGEAVTHLTVFSSSWKPHRRFLFFSLRSIVKRALRVGITGKFGSGKSTVSTVFREQGIEVIDSDSLAKSLMQEVPAVREKLAAILGNEAYVHDELNRSFIAEKIFSNSSLREQVEAVVHPAVLEAIDERFRHAEAGSIVAVESALLFQTSLWLEFDYIVLTDSSDEAILARSAQANKFDAQTVQARLREQAYEPAFKDAADFVIPNEGTTDELAGRARFVASLLRALAHRDLPEIPLHQLDDEEEPVQPPTIH